MADELGRSSGYNWHPLSHIGRLYAVPLIPQERTPRRPQHGGCFCLIQGTPSSTLGCSTQTTRTTPCQALTGQKKKRDFFSPPLLQFSASDYLQYRPSYPAWVYELIARYHATGQISASTLLQAQGDGTADPPARPLPGVRWERVLDLGCGPGIGSIALLPYFDRVTGIDPSSTMIDKALRDPEDPLLPNSLRPQPIEPGSKTALLTACPRANTLGRVEYVRDSALTLENYLAQYGVRQQSSDPAPEAAQVDLVVAFESAHWFTPYHQLWKTLDRIVRPGGSVVFVAYTEIFLPDFPDLSSLIDRFLHGQPPPHEEDGLGPFWESGRFVLEAGLIDLPAPWVVVPPSDRPWDENSFQRRRFSYGPGACVNPRWPSQCHPAVPKAGAEGGERLAATELQAGSQLTMTRTFTWDHLEAYMNTYSCVFTYRVDHPEDQQNGGGITCRFIQRMQRDLLTRLRANDPQATIPSQFTVQWPLHVVAAKKAT